MKHILVADDEIDIVESMREMLSPYFAVDIATTGIEILRLCDKESYEGLIIDVDFGPGIGGLEIASLVREKNKNIKILIFSAVDYSDAIRQQAVDLGAVFCEKPLDLAMVLRIMGE